MFSKSSLELFIETGADVTLSDEVELRDGDVAVDGDEALFKREAIGSKPWLGEPKTSLIVWRLCVYAKDGRFRTDVFSPSSGHSTTRRYGYQR